RLGHTPADHVPDCSAPEVMEQFVWDPAHSAPFGLDVEEARGDARVGPRLAEINDPLPLAMKDQIRNSDVSIFALDQTCLLAAFDERGELVFEDNDAPVAVLAVGEPDLLR